mmetsp:Transcript_9397/g.14167  ORF Transcript_9397/g.14167 Transcript_9397/m.14167 type:complete len:636 (-) Transcript_9397:114-2021(-)
MFASMRRARMSNLLKLGRTSSIAPFRRNIAFEKNHHKLKVLESEASTYPGDASKQVAFLKELGKEYPDAVIRWCESGRAVMNEAVAKEYNAAKNKILLQIRGLSSKNGGAKSLLGMAGISADNPVYVAMSPPDWKSNVFTTFKYIGLFFLTWTLMSTAMDGGGIGSKLMPGTNINIATQSDKKFTDVRGVDEAKSELQDIVHYLRDPAKLTRLGGNLPRGVLLTGPPGTGKTLLARAIAGEANVPFFYTSGSEFEEMFVGLGAKRVRDLFKEAKAMSPCIIFIDEIDAVGSSRQMKMQNYSKQTLNQLLVEMDGFVPNSGVVVIAATNFPESLDPALVRPGRFDRHITVPLPDIKGRFQILDLYSKKTKMGKNVNLNTLARATPGMSGADLFNIINQAAVEASLRGAEAITMEILEWAKDKIMMGAERKTAVITKETATLTAYHEGGHALMAHKTEGADPIHKATIMPRGHSLGMVMQLPVGDQTSMSRKQMIARLDVLMGGRVAEELVFGPENVTSGASSDIQQATKLARSMVTRFGMSDEVGLVYHEEGGMAGSTKSAVDSEVKRILEESYSRAKTLLTANRSELDVLASALLEHESLTGPDIKEILSGKRIKQKQNKGVMQRAAAASSVGVS